MPHAHNLERQQTTQITQSAEIQDGGQ